MEAEKLPSEKINSCYSSLISSIIFCNRRSIRCRNQYQNHHAKCLKGQFFFLIGITKEEENDDKEYGDNDADGDDDINMRGYFFSVSLCIDAGTLTGSSYLLFP